MTLYRCLDSIRHSEGTLALGTISDLEMLSGSGRRKLLAKGVIAPIQSPPLSVLPNRWKGRSTKLRKGAGIESIEDLLEADVSEVAAKLSVRPSTIRKWQEEARSFLDA